MRYLLPGAEVRQAELLEAGALKDEVVEAPTLREGHDEQHQRRKERHEVTDWCAGQRA